MIVVGGGPAGISASRAAAELGADTVLVEKETEFGGNITQAFVHTICGLFLNDTESPDYINIGIPRRFCRYLRKKNVASSPYKIGRVFVLPLYPESEFVHSVVDDWLNTLDSLRTLSDHEVVDVEIKVDGVIVHVENNEEMTLTGDVVIDVTGDGVVGQLAGARMDTTSPKKIQLPSYIVKLSGVREEDTHGYGRLRLTRALVGAVRDDQLPEGCESVLLRPGSNAGVGYMTLNLPRNWDHEWDPLDPDRINEWSREARQRVERIVQYLRQHRKGYENCEIDAFPPRIGIRESRRITGVEQITGPDLLEGVVGEAPVAFSNWPIELWHEHSGAELKYTQSKAGIPLGALVSRTHSRLGMAGRCLSATHEALGSLRVIGTSLATGQAIGTAGYVASRDDCDLTKVSPVRVRNIITRELSR